MDALIDLDVRRLGPANLKLTLAAMLLLVSALDIAELIASLTF